MTLVPASENTDPQQRDVELTLCWSEAEQLRTALPWLLHALEDRPTATTQQRARRRKIYAILERLQAVLSDQQERTQDGRESH